MVLLGLIVCLLGFVNFMGGGKWSEAGEGVAIGGVIGIWGASLIYRNFSELAGWNRSEKRD